MSTSAVLYMLNFTDLQNVIHSDSIFMTVKFVNIEMLITEILKKNVYGKFLWFLHDLNFFQHIEFPFSFRTFIIYFHCVKFNSCRGLRPLFVWVWVS